MTRVYLELASVRQHVLSICHPTLECVLHNVYDDRRIAIRDLPVLPPSLLVRIRVIDTIKDLSPPYPDSFARIFCTTRLNPF